MKNIIIVLAFSFFALSCQQSPQWFEYPKPWRLFLGCYSLNDAVVNNSPKDQDCSCGYIIRWQDKDTIGEWEIVRDRYYIINSDSLDGDYLIKDRDERTFTIENEERTIFFEKGSC